MMRHKKCKHYDPSIKKQSMKLKRSYMFFLVLLIVAIMSVRKIQKIYAYFTDYVTMPNQFSIEAEYTIEYDSNTGTGSMNNLKVSYNVTTNLTPNAFSKANHAFVGWNTEADGSGVSYEDKAQIRNIGNVRLYAQWLNAGDVAEIDGIRYNTLQEAVDAVPTDNTETTILLLQDTSEVITVSAGKNIVFNLQTYTLSNNGINNVISNDGTIKIISGTITSSTSQGAINNNLHATLIMTGGSIVATGTRQAIYNVGGTVTISGTAYISATTGQRAAVQSSSQGTLIITGGTIISTGSSAVYSTATMTIGTKDGTSDVSSPVIRGNTYGVSTTNNFDFYDGIIMGKSAAVSDTSMIQDKEVGYTVANSTQTIMGVTYKTTYLGNRYTVTFDGNGGTTTENTRTVVYGESIGTLPDGTRADYLLDGWYTAAEGGTEIDENTKITADITFYAHWAEVNEAEIAGTKYETIQAAWSAVPTDGTQTTIKILRNISLSERLNISANQNIVLDIQEHRINNSVSSIPIIENRGTLTLVRGAIKSSATQGAINNYSNAVLNVVGGSIEATGTRQAIYNNGGTVTISGSAYITASSLERAAVQNNAGTMNILGGTIISSGFAAVVNNARLTVGTSDGNVDNTSPVFQGISYGITNNSNKTLNIYDGIIKGVTDPINGNITNIESNCTWYNSNETIGGIAYKIQYLQQT